MAFRTQRTPSEQPTIFSARRSTHVILIGVLVLIYPFAGRNVGGPPSDSALDCGLGTSDQKPDWCLSRPIWPGLCALGGLVPAPWRHRLRFGDRLRRRFGWGDKMCSLFGGIESRYRGVITTNTWQVDMTSSFCFAFVSSERPFFYMAWMA